MNSLKILGVGATIGTIYYKCNNNTVDGNKREIQKGQCIHVSGDTSPNGMLSSSKWLKGYGTIMAPNIAFCNAVVAQNGKTSPDEQAVVETEESPTDKKTRIGFKVNMFIDKQGAKVNTGTIISINSLPIFKFCIKQINFKTRKIFILVGNFA